MRRRHANVHDRDIRLTLLHERIELVDVLGSGGVIGYGSRGARNAEHPPLAANITTARQLARLAVNRLERVMTFSISR